MPTELQAPLLSLADVEGELSRFHERRHRTLDTAFYGRGEGGTVSFKVNDERVTLDVVPVGCELELRRELGRSRENKGVALLVDYTDRLPLDVQGRLAKGGLQFISREKRLANLFGALAASAPLTQSPLAAALLEESGNLGPIEGTTVDLKTAWRRYLERKAGIPSKEVLSDVQLLHFAATTPRSEAFVNRLQADPALRAALDEFLEREAGAVGVLAMRAHLVGLGVDGAAMAFVLQALRPHLDTADYVRAHMRNQLKPLMPERSEVNGASQLLERWAALAERLALRLDGGSVLARVIARADELVSDPELARFLAESRVLTAALTEAKAALAQTLTSAARTVGEGGQGRPSRAMFDAAVGALERVRRHRLSDRGEHPALVERATMAVRLLGYLAQQPDWELEFRDQSSAEPAHKLAEHYAEQGGFVDLARRLARGTRTDGLGEAIDAVLDAADRARDYQDGAFAKALPRWNEVRKAGRLLPIEKVLDRLAVDFVKERDHRKLLILLLDGMAWCTAVELLTADSIPEHGLLRWQHKEVPRPGRPWPMIAALPTITEVSRSALFAGKLLKPGVKGDASQDPDRLRDHAGFKKLWGQGPRLLLKRDALDPGGQLTVEARKHVAGGDRIVGVVLNAVDDQLKVAPGLRIRYSRDSIKALGPLLDAAKQAGRAVLLVADHGHILGARRSDTVPTLGDGGARWKEIKADAPPSASEVAVDGDNGWRAHKSSRLVMLHRESDSYTHLSHEGEHGGASLAEVVAPALLIAHEDLATEVGFDDDEELRTVAFPIPPWWTLELPVAPRTEKAATVPPEPKRKARSQPAPGQLKIFELEPPPAPVAPATSVASEPSAWSVRLTQLFHGLEKPRVALLKQRVLPALDILIEHGGRMNDELFAGKVGEAMRNVGGLIAIMGEFLNEDGFQVVRYNPSAQLVELDLGALEELFGGRA